MLSGKLIEFQQTCPRRSGPNWSMLTVLHGWCYFSNDGETIDFAEPLSVFRGHVPTEYDTYIELN